MIAAGVIAACATPACSDDPARAHLQPVRPTAGRCGIPDDATELRVTAYTGGGDVVRAVPLDGSLAIADFPLDTEQLGVEIVVGGGVVGAAGKTAPFDFAALDDGQALAVLMAPPDGLCAVADLGVARTAPLVARSGDGVLIVGGWDGAGQPLGSIERYDPTTGRFTPVEVPDVLGEAGFAGAALAELPDGRVAITGGPRAAITIYDPATHALGEPVLVESRAFHTAIAIDAEHVMLAGGCSDVTGTACSGVVRRSTKVYPLANLGSADAGPTLVAGRLGARALDLGLAADGARVIALAGGTAAADAPDATASDVIRIDATGAGTTTVIAGTFGAATVLDGGGVLTAAVGEASVIVPGTPAAVAVARPLALAGSTLTTAEDGRVVALGGTPAQVTTYDPLRDRWSTAVPAPGSDAADLGTAPSTIRLADGSLLVLGGAPASARAWIYRPSLLGPATGSVTILPGADEELSEAIATPTDPETVTRGTELLLHGSATLAPVLAGGPRIATGSVHAVTRVHSGGIALVARERSPGDRLVAELAPGSPVRLVRQRGAATTVHCTGTTLVPTFDPTAPTAVDLVIAGSTARVLYGVATLLTCSLDPDDEAVRGAWGVAPLAPGGELALVTLIVAR